MEINNKKLNNEIVLEIGKFTILWAEFEKEYCNNNCNSNSIWDFSTMYDIKREVLKDFAEKLKGRVDYYGVDEFIYVNYNLVPEGARTPSSLDLNTIQDFLNFNGANLVAGAFLAIYRIRNNLLHGLKILSELNGQLELFKAMNKVLENIRRK